jgi:YidC/Oxa1 family membrane protein insertase
MNDIRRTILWVIFGFSMVLLWDKWQIHNGKKPTFFPSPQTVSAPAAADVKPATSACPSPPLPLAGDVPGAANAAAQPAAAVTPRQDVIVGSDVMRLTFDSEGGTLKASELLKYSDTVDDKKLMQVFEENAKRVYLVRPA